MEQLTFSINGTDYTLDIPNGDNLVTGGDDLDIEVYPYFVNPDDPTSQVIMVATVDEYEAVWTDVRVPIPSEYANDVEAFADIVFHAVNTFTIGE